MQSTIMTNVLVTGAKGQLGSEIEVLSATYEKYTFFFTDRSLLDICTKEAIEEYCKQNSIDVIINCAGYTAVDKAEEDEANADRVNHLAVKYLAQVAKKESIKLIHISTDYVFDGKHCRPYVETDDTQESGVYANTKRMGEKEVQKENPKNTIIIRTSWVYSSFGNNFVKTMLRLGRERKSLGVIFDQVGTPTYARDLAKVILDIVPKIENNNVEIYHYTNEGVTSWYDFSKAIFELSGIGCDVQAIETKAYPTPATRPPYSVLNKKKIKEHFNLTIPYWRESLKECLSNMGEKKR